MYYHKKLQLLLVVFVDDLKMAGPEKNLKKGWDMLRPKLRIEMETELGLYLGCMIKKGEASLHDGTKVKTVGYDMSDLLKMTVEKYQDIVGEKTLRTPRVTASPSGAHGVHVTSTLENGEA